VISEIALPSVGYSLRIRRQSLWVRSSNQALPVDYLIDRDEKTIDVGYSADPIALALMVAQAIDAASGVRLIPVVGTINARSE
jgi:hypothetical protein